MGRSRDEALQKGSDKKVMLTIASYVYNFRAVDLKEDGLSFTSDYCFCSRIVNHLSPNYVWSKGRKQILLHLDNARSRRTKLTEKVIKDMKMITVPHSFLTQRRVIFTCLAC
jgi:hypothetical protein